MTSGARLLVNATGRIAAVAVALVALALPGYAFWRTGPVSERAARAAVEAPPATRGAEPVEARTLLAARFGRPDRLITNEYARWNPKSRIAVRSPVWRVTSGSLFARDGAGWTGAPDAVRPNARSTNATGSAIFRAVTWRRFGDVSVSLSLLNNGLSTTRRTPGHGWDGVHVFLRYHSPYSLYAVSVNRRDGRIVVKKKVPGGSANRGSYYQLARPVSYEIPYDRWQRVRASVETNRDGSVTLRVYVRDKLVVTATDRGIGGPPLTAPGRVGLRGDNDDFAIDDFVVTALR